MVGGPMSYGACHAASFHWAGTSVGRNLKGARPADLPVMQPTKFVLAINLIERTGLPELAVPI
jgi:putative tryptophan/tyrosine transport system substrate-binding protein